MSEPQCVWVFSGVGSKFPSAVFNSKEKAELWIKKYSLSGVLTLYPIDESVYNWAISHNYYTPRNEHERSSEFIQSFSSASQAHSHYENGNAE